MGRGRGSWRALSLQGCGVECEEEWGGGVGRGEGGEGRRAEGARREGGGVVE
jgi:hypothetical protein